MHMCEYVFLGKLHESRHPIILVVHNNSPKLMRACHMPGTVLLSSTLLFYLIKTAI